MLSHRYILGELQDIIGLKDVSCPHSRLTKITALLKQLKEYEDVDDNNTTEWLQVDDKDQGYKKSLK